MIRTIIVAIILGFRFLFSFSKQLVANSRENDNQRQVWAWANGGQSAEIQIAQLQNATWANLIDGIQVWCGDCHFQDQGIFLNYTLWIEQCMPVVTAATLVNVKFQLMISGAVPESAIQNPKPFVDDAIFIYNHLGGVLDGFSLDDERDCAPRANTHAFRDWIGFQNAFATSLAEHGIHVTSAVQALFAIENDSNNGPCKFKPANYELDPLVPEVISTSILQKWLIMDTYYFSTGRFMGTLDWYLQNIPLETLAVGMMNRTDLTEDDLVARFHALHHSGIDWINIFMMPIADQFLPFLRRWKTRCQGCGQQSVLGCYDMSITCDNKEGVHDDLATHPTS